MSRRATRSILFLTVLTAAPSAAQTVRSVGGRSEVFAGSELERYVRVLQAVGAVALYPWSSRSFSPAELDALLPFAAAHPWAGRYDWTARHSRWTFEVVRPSVALRFNSTFPYGWNDGALWAGRGITTAVQAGFAARYGPLSLTVAPVAFRSENTGFTLLPNGESGRLAYADGLYAQNIDLPQRFGDRPYEMLDPGQSTLRVDTWGVAVGVSTANQFWGPAVDFPFVLGDNAAGFPHAFLGTAHPISLWGVRLHGRLVWGRLEQSAYSPETGAGGRRFMAGFLGIATVRWVPGLELGLSRFAHSLWRAGGPTLNDLLRAVGSRYGANQVNLTNDNQLASAFFRWVLPRRGVEVYGEYGREDYNQNLRDLLEEPDHIGGYSYMFGFRKVVWRPGRRLISARIELQHAPAAVTPEGRERPPVYIHSGEPAQGHTLRGQLLGSAGGLGGGATTVALDMYHPRGRWTVELTRILRQDFGDFPRSGQANPQARDIQHAVGVEGLFFRGRYDVNVGLTGVYELNRNLRGDAFNLNAQVGIRANVTR